MTRFRSLWLALPLLAGFTTSASFAAEPDRPTGLHGDDVGSLELCLL